MTPIKIEPASDIPAGWTKLDAYAVYQRGDAIIILGNPDTTTPEWWHNCDYMGCSSVSHVICRAQITRADGDDCLNPEKEAQT